MVPAGALTELHCPDPSIQAAGYSSRPHPATWEWPHLETTEGHIHLAAALIGTMEHLKQAIGIHHPRPLAPSPPGGEGAHGVKAPTLGWLSSFHPHLPDTHFSGSLGIS